MFRIRVETLNGTLTIFDSLYSSYHRGDSISIYGESYYIENIHHDVDKSDGLSLIVRKANT